MLVKGSSLILSGKPFGFSLWDIGTNPLSPRMLYAYSDNIGAFSSMGGWTPDYYAGGAMGILGPYVLTSGAAGASLIDTTDKGAARELFRYPPVNVLKFPHRWILILSIEPLCPIPKNRSFTDFESRIS
jgi:hypothetical protein